MPNVAAYGLHYLCLRKNQIPAAVPHIVPIKAVYLKLMCKIISDALDRNQLLMCLLAVHAN